MLMVKKRILFGFLIVLTMLLMISLLNLNQGVFAQSLIPKIPEVEVKYGHALTIDHTYAVIGMEKGWFEELGIKILPEPYGKVLSPTERAAALVSGSVDIVSGSAAALIPALKQAPNLRFFVIADIFQGYAVLANPELGLKSYSEFIQEGFDKEEALRMTVEQFRGKKWTWEDVPQTFAFIQLVLSKANMTSKDVEGMPVPDAKTIDLMLPGHADLQTGTAIGRIMLEGKGFKPILTIGDVVGASTTEAGSLPREYEAIYFDGWNTTSDFWEKQHDTVLRMASVCFRIIDFMKKNEDEALNIHVPFMNSVTGSNLTIEEGRIIYNSLDPFFTFEEQYDWYYDKNDPFYYTKEVEVKINMYVEKGLYEPNEINVESIAINHLVYQELYDLKLKSEKTISDTKNLNTNNKSAEMIKQANELLQKAEYFYNAYDFLDSYQFAKAAYDLLR